MTEAFWVWKLKQLPTPVENVWLAVHNEKPIFQCAGIPIRYQLPAGERLGMVAVDAMTAPEFQRQGILTTVGQFAYETWRAAGVSFVIGLPNERWGSRTRALGWVELFALRWLVRPLRPEVVLARRLRIPAISRLTLCGAVWNGYWDRKVQWDTTVQVRAVTQAGPEFDRLWQVCRFDHQVSPIRDSAWVTWRYLRPPSCVYHVLFAERSGHPVGYIVYRLEERQGRTIGTIAEVLTSRADVRACSTLISHAVEALQAAGVDVAATLAIPGTPTDRAFRQAGFFARAAFHVHLVPLDPNLPMDVLSDSQSWNMTGGDFDIL